jgi:hypothetical protein
MRSREFITEAASPSTTKVQQDINNKINNIHDIDELHQIYSYVRKIDIGGGFEDVFKRDEDLRQLNTLLTRAMVDVKAPFNDKMGFAKELVTTGIINIEELLNPGVKHDIVGVVQTKYPNVFQQIYPELMNISGAYASGGTKTNRGKGEFFLAISSPRIIMAKDDEKGDLVVDKKIWVEVKGNLARIKGRSGYGTTDTAYHATKKNVTDFLTKNLPKVQAPAFSVGIGSRATLWKDFGPYCINNGVAANLVSTFLKEQLTTIIKSLYLEIDSASLNSLLECVGSDNAVMNWPAFINLAKSVAFQYYKTSDKFAGILLINGNSCQYITDPLEFASAVKMKKLGFETGQQNGLQIEFV